MSGPLAKLRDLFSDLPQSHIDLPPTTLSNRFVNVPEKLWERIWAKISQYANPIVVKEARQSLNSKQFLISFSLTLIAIAFWTVTAVITQLPQMYYVPGGMVMLVGFMVILTFPLILVIPFSAFRSMILESEERTFELVSISSLSAQQIVAGKMLSAMLQTIIYLSTLTPCFVVTYLLRGVQISSILYYLIFTLLISIAATALAILIAAIGRAKLLQVIASIFVLAGLLILTIFWSIFTASTFTMWYFEDLGPTIVCGLIMFVATVLPVCLRSSAAAIDFPSENHATALRVRLTLFILNCLGWGLWWAILTESEKVCWALVFVSFIVFLIIGGFVVSENGIISPRAQRTLPRTVLGRVFGTWFFPGAGLGYVLLVCLFTAYLVAWAAFAWLGRSFQINIEYVENIVWECLICWLYFVFYTGITRLIMLSINRSVSGRMVVGFLVQTISIVAGMAFPYLLATALSRFQSPDYGWHQFINMGWTFYELDASGISSVLPSILVLALFAIAIFGLNLILCGRDVLLVRIHLPTRLQQEINLNQPKPMPVPDPFA